MQVLTDEGSEMYVNFYYGNKDNPDDIGRKCLDKANSKSIITTCKISQKNGSGESVVITEGSCVKHRTDMFSKSLGRKIALTRAMRVLDRDTRRQIWMRYFETHNDMRI